MNKNFIKNCIEKFQKLRPKKVSDEYLDNYKTDDKNNILIKDYNTIQKIKVHIWAHILAIIGWLLAPYSLPKYFGFLIINLNSYKQIDILMAFSLSFFLCCYVESIFFPDFRIKLKFVYENKIYSLFWNIGIILFVIFCLKIIGIEL